MDKTGKASKTINAIDKFLFDENDGTLRIGTIQKATGYLVDVGGKIIAEEVRVALRASWPDYVFKKNYKLMPLPELEKFEKENSHLPGFIKAEIIEKQGADLGETQRIMVQTIEEMSLYIIELNKSVDLLKQEVKDLQSKSRK